MKIVFIFMFLINLFLSANTLDRANSYSEALKLAKEDNRAILVLISTKNCPWCKRLKKNVLSDSEVVSIINKNFIFIEIDKHSFDYPDYLYARFVPTLYLIDPNSEESVIEMYGYKSKKEFMKEINSSESQKYIK